MAIDTVKGESLTDVRVPTKFVELRADPFGGGAGDTLDAKRIEMVMGGWAVLDDVMRPFIRQVEENVRMLAGQQHATYHPMLGWLDVGSWLPQEGEKWRRRPTHNKLLPWYIITHARCTENPPIVTFVPGPDAKDADLAETMDIALKTLWREMSMVDINDQLFMWVISAGRGYLQTRIDPTKGPWRKWTVTEGMVPLVDEFGEPIIDPNTGEPAATEAFGEEIPLGPDGAPRAVITPDGLLQVTGEPHAERAGSLHVSVLSPLNVRGSWGPEPWYQKRVHQTKLYYSPEEFFELFGVEVEPDVRGDAASDVMEIDRLLYGSGFYSAVNSQPNEQSALIRKNELIEVTTRIQAPCHYGGMEETEDSPGGRMTVVAGKQVIYDGPRAAKFPYTSPIHAFDFLRLPGRPSGTSAQESMNPIVRYNNSLLAREMAHVDLVTNPKGIIDSQSGLRAKSMTNEPGTWSTVNRRPGVPAMEWIDPPRLGAEVFQLHTIMGDAFDELGNLRGTQGEIPSPSASGELVKELRFNTDRFLGPTMRRAVEEYGRMIQTWMALLPTVWDEETVLSLAGEDNVARTITVLPDIFHEGKVDVVPDVESMLPEGRGERQTRAFSLLSNGLISPEHFFEIANFPHLSRAAKPGGIDRVTAEQENGKLAQADRDPDSAFAIPVYEWYDHQIHVDVHLRFMKSPAFVKASPEVQNAFVQHYMAHTMILQQQMMQQMAMQAEAAGVAPGEEEQQDGGSGGKPRPKATSNIGAPPLAPPPAEPPSSIFPARYPTHLSTPMT